MRATGVAIVTSVILLVGAACSPAANDSTRPPATSSPSAAGTPARPSATPGSARPSSRSISHVVAISIDGLNPRAISELGPSGAPTFHRLMREGASTLDARTEREQTRTLPNHTGMLTGRRIDARRGGHGVTYNTDRRTPDRARVRRRVRLQCVRRRPRSRRSDRAVRHARRSSPSTNAPGTPTAGETGSASTTAGTRSIGSSSTPTTPAWWRQLTPTCGAGPESSCSCTSRCPTRSATRTDS